MAWIQVAEFPVSSGWAYSSPLSGNCFRFRSDVRNLNPVSFPFKALAAIAYSEGEDYYHHAITTLYHDPSYRVIVFPELILGMSKHIAIRGLRITRLPILWVITIDVWDSYVERDPQDNNMMMSLEV